MKRKVDLPPAGHVRNEELKRRSDALEEQKEGMPESFTIDPASFNPDRDILQVINSLEVSHADPMYVYAWARCTVTDTHQVDEKLATSVRVPGGGTAPCWDVVRGDMKEALERKTVEGTRRIGDVILMRCRKDVYALLLQWADLKRKRQQEGAVSGLQELGAKHGVQVHVIDGMPTDERLQHAIKHAAASQMANAGLETQIREGRVPGMPVGR